MTKFIPSLFGCLALLFATTLAFAADPAANPAPPTAAPQNKSGATNAPTATPPPAPPPAPAPAAAPSVTFADYMKELTSTLKLSDTEKQEITSFYVADNGPLQKILNDDSLSPIQKAQQVSNLRDARNTKILDLLNTLDRQHAFVEIEAEYRVILTDLAANGQLVAAAK
jgi:hypothetical protein